jgi:hypothetical protein
MAASLAYTYTPLDLACRWVRLVELQPASSSNISELVFEIIKPVFSIVKPQSADWLDGLTLSRPAAGLA